MTNSVFLQAGLIVLIASIPLSLLVLAMNKYLPKRYVQERHDVCLSVYLIVPFIFVLALMPSQTAQHVEPAVVERDSGEVGAIKEFVPQSSVSSGEEPISGMNSSIELSSVFKWLGYVWLAGGVLASLKLARDFWDLQSLVSRSNVARYTQDLSLSRDLEIRTSSEISTPMLVGYWKEKILVPEDFVFDKFARPVLEHEIAHSNRKDNLMALVQRLITIVFWWNLALVPLKNIIADAREKLCDNQAAVITGEPLNLAKALLDTARSYVQSSPALVAAANGNGIADRVRLLAEPSAKKSRPAFLSLPFILPVVFVAAFSMTPRMGVAIAEEEHPIIIDDDGIWINGEDLDFLEGLENLEGLQELKSLEKLESLEGLNALKKLKDLEGLEKLEKLQELEKLGVLEELRELSSLREFIEADDFDHVSSADHTLFRAAKRGNLKDVHRALQNDANANAIFVGDGTPLIAAVRAKKVDVVEALLEAGADPNLMVAGDGSPLISAASSRRVPLVRVLLENGADPNLIVPGDGSPLISAARRGDDEIVSMLLRAGGEAHLAAPRDGSPLIAAAMSGSVKTAKMLVEAGADPNGFVLYDETPLVGAAQQGDRAMVEYLLSVGADISLTVPTGAKPPKEQYRSALSEARRRGHKDLALWLKEQGAEHNEPAE